MSQVAELSEGAAINEAAWWLVSYVPVPSSFLSFAQFLKHFKKIRQIIRCYSAFKNNLQLSPCTLTQLVYRWKYLSIHTQPFIKAQRANRSKRPAVQPWGGSQFALRLSPTLICFTAKVKQQVRLPHRLINFQRAAETKTQLHCGNSHRWNTQDRISSELSRIYGCIYS